MVKLLGEISHVSVDEWTLGLYFVLFAIDFLYSRLVFEKVHVVIEENAEMV